MKADYVESLPTYLNNIQSFLELIVAALSESYSSPISVPIQQICQLLQRLYGLNDRSVVCQELAAL
jgi:hypothetical protein